MAYSRITIPGDGTTRLLTINFPLGVMQDEVVTVRVTGESVDRSFTWQGSNQILVAAPAAGIGQNYVIQRRTPRTSVMVEWMDGEGITDTTLTVDQMQALHLIHEVLDAIGDDGSGGGGAVTDAPLDGKYYVRRSGMWTENNVAAVAGLTAALAGKADTAHTHTIANVTGLQTALDGKAPTSHTHTIANVTGLQSALDGKAPTSHTHTISQVTGLQAALDNAGTVSAFSSRANAIAATIPANVQVLAVVHSGQVLFYRRFTGSAQDQGFSALKTNGNTVYWTPAHTTSPLHWGAEGDGTTNDRPAFMDMLRFLYGTPASNGAMPAAFSAQRPFVIDGHNRNYALAAPIIMGNIGTAVDTGMVYNLRIRDMRLKAIAGDWDSQMVTNVPKAMIIAGWNFAADYSDQYSGIYDVMLDHVTFDMNFLTGATWVCNTYEFTMHECRYQHPGVGKVVCDTSVSLAAQGTRPFGYNTGNGAYTIIRPNIEGLVGESGLSYPGGNTIATMGTIGIRIYTNDFRVDGPIISGVSTSMDIYGRAGQIYNLHPWSRELRLRPSAHNVMFCNGYLDYTKFILESFSHMFVGMHWILPADTGSDRGVELRATAPNTTGEGLMFVGCTFASESLGIKYTTDGSGTWVGSKERKVTIKSCKYGNGHAIEDIERFEDKHGFTVSNNAHWFRTGNSADGEIRLVGNVLHIGKDRSADGLARINLQSELGDQPTAYIMKETDVNGNLHIRNEGTGLLGLEAGANMSLNLQTDGFAMWRGQALRVGYGRAVAGPAELTLSNATGLGTPSAAFRSFAGAGVEIAAQMTGGWFRVNVPAQENALTVNAAGNTELIGNLSVSGTATATGEIRSTTAAVSTGSKSVIAVTDTVLGVRLTAAGTIAAYVSNSSALNIARSNAGAVAQFGNNGTKVGDITVNASTTTYNTSSDARLKTDFREIDPGIIDRIRVYDYAWISNPDSRSHGVKAQELEGLVPDAVSKNQKPEEEWINGEVDYSWGVDYSKLVPLLVATIKDLRKRIGVLEDAQSAKPIWKTE